MIEEFTHWFIMIITAMGTWAIITLWPFGKIFYKILVRKLRERRSMK